jgi:hypothetical protein
VMDDHDYDDDIVTFHKFKTCEGEIFHTHPDQPWGPASLPYNGYQVSFSEVNRPGCGIDRSPQSSAEGKERVEQCL